MSQHQDKLIKIRLEVLQMVKLQVDQMKHRADLKIIAAATILQVDLKTLEIAVKLQEDKAILIKDMMEFQDHQL